MGEGLRIPPGVLEIGVGGTEGFAGRTNGPTNGGDWTRVGGKKGGNGGGKGLLGGLKTGETGQRGGSGLGGK
eukprot:3504742-Pleurochrysis_carterae.AAC.1